MHLPQHIAIIMDGNGRWAKQKKMPVSYGHKCGADAIQNLIEESDKLGIKYITAYTFSTENWKRPKSEVTYLMNLLQEFLNDTSGRLDKSNIRIKFIGSKDKLKKTMIKSMERIEYISKHKTGLTFIIALNYGARQEITEAVKKISVDVKEGILDISQINEELISSYLYTKDIPDPDLIIRPSGEKRLSNFLLYQASYSELWYSDILWPDFNIEHLKEAIVEYNNRKRRFGGRADES
ncbi:MAG: isoprenyl transferase [Clostridia bacterium]|nr:isoprenyl transferase [Clostridia bacterium]NLV34643.1 isoprenyl transferase [Clostridiaceae bacterium]